MQDRIEAKYRRSLENQRDGHDHIIRKAIRREKPAFIRAQTAKANAKRDVPITRELEVVEMNREAIRDLARALTDHIIVDHNGVIFGEKLEWIYEDLGRVFRESTDTIKIAIEIACQMELLEKAEATGSRGPIYACAVPRLKPNRIAA